ncbi:MAG TPA: isocitrate/isopropylmalate family dehydrogenase [Anaerolineales bacterium]|nr:isocitrate/isopropylmalate family dehydrogenase [Anaerolineales bacterium]
MPTRQPPEPVQIAVMHGDQTGEELLLQALRLTEPDLLGLTFELQHFDLSLKNRRATNNGVVHEAGAAMLKSHLGLKAATITPEQANDVGSPNAIIRNDIHAQVILRTGRRIPNVRPVGGVHAPIAVARMAVEDAYGAKEWRETSNADEVAFRTSQIHRSTCRAVAEFSFLYAEKTNATVFGGPKYTVSPIYEGMFKEELDAAAARHPGVTYRPLLIDATLALLLQSGGQALVVPALNRDGDLLSDLILQMFGSIAGSESLVLAFDESTAQVKVVMAEAPHGTAPALEGKDVANPMAMILALAALLSYVPGETAERASRAIYESIFEAIHDGKATTDLGGGMGTSSFTDEVIRRVGNKLEVWSALS